MYVQFTNYYKDDIILIESGDFYMMLGDYLRIINGIPAGVPLNPKNVMYTGFVDVEPKIVASNVSSMDASSYEFEGDSMVVRRTFGVSGQNISLNRKSSLSDDISLHLGKYENASRLLEDTIQAFVEIKASEDRICSVTGDQPKDYQSRIDALSSALETLRNDGPSLR